MFPDIEINKDFTTELDFLKTIHEYYPIGLPAATKQYSGYKRLCEKLEIKINSIINNTLPKASTKLIEDARQTCGNLVVLNEYYRQFPSYAFTVELSRSEQEGLSVVNMIRVKLSLLTDHVAIFYEQMIMKKANPDSEPGSLSIIIRIISSQSSADPGKTYFNNLKDLCKTYFPAHAYADYNLLFNRFIRDGMPYGMDYLTEKGHAIYSYLFDNDYDATSCNLIIR